MRKVFPGHFKEEDGEFERLWDEGLFVFDANILLNLYRYSEATKEDFLGILREIQGRIWLPHKAAEEFLYNRLSVIGKQADAYEETIKAVEKLQKSLESGREHPFVEDDVMDSTRKNFENLINELRKNKEVHSARMLDDQVKEKVADVFGDNVGQPYEEEKLNKIYEEGEDRYKKQVPPGYMDNKKGDGQGGVDENGRRFGDLVVWYEVMDKAISSQQSVIFVTDDRKDDWWLNSKGKTIGPRPELINEFANKTGLGFHMYQADRFLELASSYLDRDVNKNTLEEIRDVRDRDDDLEEYSARREAERKELEIAGGMSDRRYEHEEELKRIDSEIKRLMADIDELESMRVSLHESYNLAGDFKKMDEVDKTMADKIRMEKERLASILQAKKSRFDELRGLESLGGDVNELTERDRDWFLKRRSRWQF